jgi:uncharacterized protein (DUF983 family)
VIDVQDAKPMSLYLVVEGTSWIVERRYETIQRATPRLVSQELLFLFFMAPDGEIRRGEIADDFPTNPESGLLQAVWRNAEVLRHGSPGEMQSRSELVLPRMRDVARLFWRAVRLRCPNCKGRPVLRSWFKLRDHCPRCGIRMERGESDDYFLGGVLFNVVLSEVVFVVLFLAGLFMMWPNVPWDGLEYVLAGAMIAAPILLYPVSRLMWLALDILMRPPDAEEMEWHAASASSADEGDD